MLGRGRAECIPRQILVRKLSKCLLENKVVSWNILTFQDLFARLTCSGLFGWQYFYLHCPEE